MIEIDTFTTEELLRDNAEAWHDLGWCRLAEACGIETYGDDESVADRIELNKRVIEITRAELQRRGIGDIEIVSAPLKEIDVWITKNVSDAG